MEKIWIAENYESSNLYQFESFVSKKYNLANFQISQENAQKIIRFEVNELGLLAKLTNIFAQENFIKIIKIYCIF